MEQCKKILRLEPARSNHQIRFLKLTWSISGSERGSE
jgi:hypothetical protein